MIVLDALVAVGVLLNVVNAAAWLLGPERPNAGGRSGSIHRTAATGEARLAGRATRPAMQAAGAITLLKSHDRAAKTSIAAWRRRSACARGGSSEEQQRGGKRQGDSWRRRHGVVVTATLVDPRGTTKTSKNPTKIICSTTHSSKRRVTLLVAGENGTMPLPWRNTENVAI